MNKGDEADAFGFKVGATHCSIARRFGDSDLISYYFLKDGNYYRLFSDGSFTLIDKRTVTILKLARV